MKNLLFVLCIVFTSIVFGQKTAEERLSVLNENYAIMIDKMDQGTLTMDDECYNLCRKMISKIKSYDSYTTGKTEEYKTMKSGFEDIKVRLQVGVVYLSSSKDGKKPVTEFVAGKPMFLIMECGKSIVKESLNDHPDDYSHKVLKLQFNHDDSKAFGMVYHEVAAEKLDEHHYVMDLTVTDSNSEFESYYLFLGELGKGNHDVTLKIQRGGYSSLAQRSMPMVKIPLHLSIKDAKYANKLNETATNDYANITLGESVVSDPDLEATLFSLFSNYEKKYTVKKVNIIEDWYELKDNGRVNYLKINCFFGVTDASGKCYRVAVDFVKDNESNSGVKWGETRVFSNGSEFKYIQMPCDSMK
jgi:hypothetical protein